MPLLEKPARAGQSIERAVDARDAAARAHTHGAGASIPDQSRAQRRRSFDVSDFPLPTGREEDWRFTPVEALAALLSEAPTDDRPGDPAVTLDVSTLEHLVVDELRPGQAPRGTALVPADRAAVVASAGSPRAVHVRIPAEQTEAEAVWIRVHGNGVGRRSNAHYVIEAGPYSQAVVILEHTGTADHNGNVEVIVGDGAALTVVSLQQWDGTAKHLGQHDALVGRDAKYRHIAVTLGGAVVRLNSNVRYAGPGGEATMYGVYFADSGQHLEHRSFVDHNAPHCVSTVTYKGALRGASAHTVWVGDVLIRKEAEGTKTYELNRNLVLSDGARADSVPNLEIETGEIIGAGHASSTGRFDDEQLFYLQARGIPEHDARRLVVRGFFADIVSRIGVPHVVATLMDAVDAELRAADQ